MLAKGVKESKAKDNKWELTDGVDMFLLDKQSLDNL